MNLFKICLYICHNGLADEYHEYNLKQREYKFTLKLHFFFNLTRKTVIIFVCVTFPNLCCHLYKDTFGTMTVFSTILW